MKNLRHICMALILTPTLSVAALAGQVNCPGVVQDPPKEGTTSATQSEPDSTITDALLLLIEVVLVPY